MRERRWAYPAEYRRHIVELVRGGRTAAQLASEFECSHETIRQWVRRAQQEEASATYEYYCLRGDMENRLKEQKALYADRTSTHEIYSNQTRIYISAVAYMLLSALRRLGLQGTELAKAQSPTIRAKLLKITVQVKRPSKRLLRMSFEERSSQKKLYIEVLERLLRIKKLTPV